MSFLNHGSGKMINVESIERDKGKKEIGNFESKKECWQDVEKSCHQNLELILLEYVIFYVLPLIYILFVIVYFVSALL